MKNSVLIMSFLLLICSCGSKTSQNESNTTSSPEGTDIAIGSCSVRFLANDSEEASLLKGYLVKNECGINSEEALLKKLRLDLRS